MPLDSRAFAAEIPTARFHENPPKPIVTTPQEARLLPQYGAYTRAHCEWGHLGHSRRGGK